MIYNNKVTKTIEAKSAVFSGKNTPIVSFKVY